MISRVREIFNGEYDIPYSHQSPVTVDIGANIGGFAAWASQRWPGSVIHCYEPLPQNFELEFWRGTGNLACENRNRCQMRFSVHTTRKPAAPPRSDLQDLAQRLAEFVRGGANAGRGAASIATTQDVDVLLE